MIPLNIINMVAEFTSEHNDGWTRESYKEQLLAIRDYIDGVLGDCCVSCRKPLVVAQHLDFVETRDGKFCISCVERGKHLGE